MEQPWAEELNRRMAIAIKTARAGRSAQWLADETERLGHPISRAAIANYESGRKKGLDVAELLVLAAALRIPPLTILYPKLPDGPVEVLPTVQVTSWDAAAWFSGEASSPDPSHDPWPASQEYELVRSVRERRSQLHAMAQYFALIQRFAATAGGENKVGGPFSPEYHAYTAQLNSLEQELARIEEAIRKNGGVIRDR
jgi:transcriptional regulator with XRE-family HTH domain